MLAKRLLQVRATRASARRRAFTLVELMVVIAVIMVLLSLLIVGLNVATRTAQGASTRALMQAMSQGLVQFKEDVGYFPPILGSRRQLLVLPDIDDVDEIQQWGSITSPAEYLLGYDSDRYDGYGNTQAGEIPFIGFRHPGVDGAWGASLGTGFLDSRDPPIPDPNAGVSAGRVFGPYLQVDDERLIAALDDNGNVVFPGDDGYQEPQPDGSYAKVICDYWGQPIQYFRRQYPPGALGQSYRPGVDYNGDGDIDADDNPTLSDVIRLRPYELPPGAATETRFTDTHPQSSLSNNLTSFALETAEFGLLSTGADRRKSVLETRNDEFAGEFNKDNIVELGP